MVSRLSLLAFLSFLPSSAAVPAPEAPIIEPARRPTDLVFIVPTSSRDAYDTNDVIDAIIDADTCFP